MTPKSQSKTVLVLRTCSSDMTSHGDFKWKKKGIVAAPDWNDQPKCGGGLHGLLWGEGDGSLLNWAEDAKWLVVEVDEATIVHIDGKVKFPRGRVVFCGTRDGACDYLDAHGSADKAVTGSTRTAGYRGTATAGVGGCFSIKWWDSKNSRYRVAWAYVGEDGIKPNALYTLNDKHKFVKVQS